MIVLDAGEVVLVRCDRCDGEGEIRLRGLGKPGPFECSRCYGTGAQERILEEPIDVDGQALAETLNQRRR